MTPQINAFIGCDAPFARARAVLFGAPYDATTSFRPGTRFGPDAMRRESFGIETYSLAEERDLAEEGRVFDAGDLELPFGDQERMLELVEARAAAVFDAGKFPFLVGGEHLVTLGCVRAAARRHPGLRILHFDAHADLRASYLGNPLSHACVMRRCHSLLGDGRIFQFGIRSAAREEHDFIRAGRVATEFRGVSRLDEAVRAIGPSAPVYLSVDLDVLDPSVFPGTGTPEAGGLGYDALLDAVRRVARGLNVVAADNVELNPALDPSGRSTALACTLLREELLAFTR